MTTSTGPTLLAQIDTELQSIQAKLRDGSATGGTIGGLIATAKTVLDLINDSGQAGTGLGLKASIPSGADLETWLNAAIVTETP